MNQDTARKSFEDYLKNSGQKVRFIAKQISCHEATICRWRKGKNIKPKLYDKLIKFLLSNKTRLI